MAQFNRITLVLLVTLIAFSGTLKAEKLGYAFSGGGARGFAHIGVLKVLEEEGLKPDYIAGSSIGAIIGGFYAMGYNAQEIENICVALDWQYLTQDLHNRKDLYIGQKRWAPYGNAVFELSDTWVPRLPSSVYVGNRINLELFKLFAASSQVSSFDELPIPFACNATNLYTGEAETFRSGSLMQALRASMSIPSLVRPFEIDSNVYIDGGVSQNLPGNLLHELGADKIIGLKVNSSLRSTENLNNLIEVLDQTINIGITKTLNEHLDCIDLLIEPDLSSYTASDYDHIREIIAIGERATREHLEAIRAFKKSLNTVGNHNSKPKNTLFDRDKDSFNIVNISVRGNEYLSSAKVQEYADIHSGTTLNTSQIHQACENAWNSQAFSTIYPELKRIDGDNYDLIIHVKERDRKQAAINITYSSDDKLSAGGVLMLNNYLLKNSKLVAEVKLGGRNELNVDYVKNYGEEWGAYYRIFPYINEKTIYNYTDHHKTSSVNSLEWGMTTGLGVFAKDIVIGEVFLYTHRTRLYKEISETPSLPLNNVISGLGVKAYRETLDDYIFPTKGSRIITKFNFARNAAVSDYSYSSLQFKTEVYLPFSSCFSGFGSIDNGTYLNSQESIKYDPFVIGGVEGFMGYSRYEISAPYYQIFSLGISTKPCKKVVFNGGFQWLRYSEKELWGADKSWDYCAYLGVGLPNKVMPARLNLALNQNGVLNSFLSLGYDFDIFKFSRK